MSDETTGETPAVVAEAIKKAAVAWVSAGGAPAVALWCVPFEGSLLLVTGTGEQPAPFLADAGTASVTMRGDHGGHIVSWPASVTRVKPDSEQWETAAPLVAGKRLNARGGTDQLVERWARECVLLRLAPSGPPTEAGDSLPHDPQADPPRPTPAARATRKPFRLHRVRRRR
ncbi:MAG TPA: hypothetical protein VHN18_02135 [Micromonosporaceae bacterium]|nr:hypothetical protein [Micromonosporaceae bacterium]